MKILVIDDQRYNLASAKMTLSEHDIHVCDDDFWTIQMHLKKGNTWDAVLTDLKMPLTFKPGALNEAPLDDIDLGFVVMTMAVNLGARVVICSDANHHQDAMTAIFEYITNGPRVAFVDAAHACLESHIWDGKDLQLRTKENASMDTCSGLIKDWLTAMKKSGLFPEVGVLGK